MPLDEVEVEDANIASTPQEPTVPSQAELYEDLKRIGELEDQKRSIQNEIDERTDRLKASVMHLERDSLLFQMLSKSFSTSTAPNRVKKTAKKKTPKKTPKKR